MQRRLTAILLADVVDYSRLMGEDETAAMAAFENLARQVFEPGITARGGGILKHMGDGWIVEFSNVSDAVASAVDIQRGLSGDAMKLRIGVHMGDVTFLDNDFHGEGVNIAARLEALAKPGHVAISDTVYNSLDARARQGFGGGAPQDLKNVVRPVGVWHWPDDGEDGQQTAEAAGSQPDRPAIAVLPFTNMSDDPGQEFFSDGITEDIITGLSRFKTLFVIARHSSFAFKDSTLSIPEIGNRLNVGYLVEGSVRRAGNKVRITAQLVDAATGNQLWADRYDRELDDIFAVQDEVTRNIVAVLPGRVQENVAERATRLVTKNMRAYEHLLRGKHLRDSLNAGDNALARTHFEQALELDPRYARAYMYLADTYVVDLWLGLQQDGASSKSLDLARKGAGLDNSDVYIQDQLGFAFLCEGLWDEAESQFTKTLSMIVNEAESMAWCGYGFLLLGRHHKALDIVHEAVRLDPMHSPSLDWVLGQSHFMTGNYSDAIRALIGEGLLNSLGHAFLTSAYSHQGRKSGAQSALSAFKSARHAEFASRDIKVNSDTVQSLAGAYKKMWRNPEDWDHLVAGLRSAGLPDG